jgi:hypothetical protein
MTEARSAADRSEHRNKLARLGKKHPSDKSGNSQTTIEMRGNNSIDLAEGRDRFSRSLRKVHTQQPMAVPPHYSTAIPSCFIKVECDTVPERAEPES